MAKAKIIELAGQKYDADWLRNVPLSQAVSALKNNHDKNQITNAWKQANGHSVRNYTDPVEKAPVKAPARKAASKKAPAKKSANK